jgi:hypothetical protein
MESEFGWFSVLVPSRSQSEALGTQPQARRRLGGLGAGTSELPPRIRAQARILPSPRHGVATAMTRSQTLSLRTRKCP